MFFLIIDKYLLILINIDYFNIYFWLGIMIAAFMNYRYCVHTSLYIPKFSTYSPWMPPFVMKINLCVEARSISKDLIGLWTHRMNAIQSQWQHIHIVPCLLLPFTAVIDKEDSRLTPLTVLEEAMHISSCQSRYYSCQEPMAPLRHRTQDHNQDNHTSAL